MISKTKNVQKRIISLALLFLFLINISLPCYSQSGFSNIGSFLNRDKKLKPEEEEKDSLVIQEILIEGNRLIPKESILEAINSKVGTKFDRDKVLTDLETIDKLGYFIHESIQANPEKTDNGVLLKIKIEENNPISQIQISGNKIFKSEDLLSYLEDLIAKPESPNKINEAIEKIESKYRESGYLLARVKDITLDPDGTLTLNINEGAIQNIIIKGNTKTKESYIKRLTPNLVTGDPYNEVLLVQDLRTLQSTGFFEDIQRTVKPSEQNPDNYDLTLDVKEKRTASFGFGGGLNSLNGAFANLGFNNSNLFGEGKSISFNGQYGTGILANSLSNQRLLTNKKTMQVEARYTDPHFLNSKNSVSLFTNLYNYNSYLVELAQERNLTAGISVGRQLTKNLASNLDLTGETVDMKEFSDKAEKNFLVDQLLDIDNGKFIDKFSDKGPFSPGQNIGDHNQDQKKIEAQKIAKEIRKEQLMGGKYLNFNPSLVFDTRNDHINPRNGWNNRYTLGQAVGIGNGSFTKLGVDLRKYIPVGKKATLAFNVQGSSALIGDIPMYNQFKAGGLYGVRGYRTFSDLGIGKRSVFSSAEFRVPVLDKVPGFKNTPIADNVKLALFTDFGYVGGNNKINRLYNRLDTAASAGLGTESKCTFLGSVRVDYGIPFMKSYWNNKNVLGRFNFGFGERF